jgi:hypothetical protein
VNAPAGLWTPHLQPGERLVWSASTSADLLRATRRRRITVALISGSAAAILAVFLGLRFLESVGGYATANIGASIVTPLYIAFALAMAVLAVGCFQRLAAKPQAAQHYAATSKRLLALDASGAIVSEMQGAEVDGVIAGGRPQTPDIYVLRKDDPKEEHVFAVEHIARPLEAKAIIEETFAQPPAAAAPQS